MWEGLIPKPPSKQRKGLWKVPKALGIALNVKKIIGKMQSQDVGFCCIFLVGWLGFVCLFLDSQGIRRRKKVLVWDTSSSVILLVIFEDQEVPGMETVPPDRASINTSPHRLSPASKLTVFEDN